MNPYQSFLIGILLTSIAFGVFIRFFAYPASLHEREVNALAAKIDTLYTTIDQLNYELRVYHATEDSLIELGLTPHEARHLLSSAAAKGLYNK